MNKQIVIHRIEFVRQKLIDAKLILNDYELLQSQRDKLALERICEEVVESATRINKEVLKLKNIIPFSYKDEFLKLKKLDIFTDEELEILSKTATFRNELAHEYLDLKNFYTISNIKTILQTYPNYLLKINQYIISIN